MSEEEKSRDMLGLAPYGETLKTLAEGVVRGAAAFLSRICLPAAEEFGLLLRDRVREWRARNAANIALLAEEKLKASGGAEGKHAHPRLVMAVLDYGSWQDQQDVQLMWAGLLASSCSEDGRDETNLMFIHLLSQLTTSQARILRYGCEKAEKSVNQVGLIQAKAALCRAARLKEISGIEDIHRLDRELDHLSSLGLIPHGLMGHDSDSLVADLSPTPLALNLYVRCQGYTGSPVAYFGLGKPSDTDE